MEERYFTLKLTVSEIGKNLYRSRIDDSPRGCSEGSGPDFSLDDDLKIWKTIPLGRADQEAFGKRLFDCIFKDKVFEKFSECKGAAESQGAQLRIVLAILSEKLIGVPWEYLHDGKSFLLKAGRLIVRVIDSLPERPAFFQPIHKLLAVIANPTAEPKEYAPFDADAHANQLRSVLPNQMKLVILRDPDEQLIRETLLKEKPEGFYFLGHGRYSDSVRGQLVLSKNGATEYLDADRLAQMIRDANVPFVYLNACASGATGTLNSFAGVAQRLMLDGGTREVVAMQTPIAQPAGLQIATRFFGELSRGRSAELAIARARSGSEDVYSWGIPVVYTHLRGTSDFERNRLASLLSANYTANVFGLILPSYHLGVLSDSTTHVKRKGGGIYEIPTDGFNVEASIEPPPPISAVYPGRTYARDDVRSAAEIVRLLKQFKGDAPAEFYESMEHGENVTHWFLFGSHSNELVKTILNNYSPMFRFGKTPGKTENDDPIDWHIDITTEGQKSKRFSIIPPYLQGEKDYLKTEDYGIIEKIYDSNADRIFFIIGGLGSRATHGCGWYLATRWRQFERVFGNNNFGVVVHFRGGMPIDSAEVVWPPEIAKDLSASR